VTKRILLALSAAFLLRPMTAFAQLTWTIPGVVKASGLNGTNYVSDLVATNPGTVPANVTWAFLPALVSTPQPTVLQPGQSLTVKDVVGTIFGSSQAAGALSVTSDQTLILRARTYNTAATGTFGVAVPVVSDGQFFRSGYVAQSDWVQQDPTTDRGYRTNIAVVFPDASGGSATVTLYDASGNQMGQKQFSLTSAGFQQVSVGSFATGPVPVGRAEMQVTLGRAAGYAVVVDNVTGDGSLFTFDVPPGGPQNVVVNGVARAGGAQGTFWRTDGRIFNRGGSPATVTVEWHPAGNSNASPPFSTISVPAGQIVDLTDILSVLFSLPSGSSGALRFTSALPVAVACRTSNLDPTGVKPGTYGAQQKPVPLTSYLMSADAGALVTGIKQDTAFRTNVGFAAGADGAGYTLTLKDANGGMLATTTASLGTFGWTQPNIGGLFPGTSIPDGAQMLVKVTSGSLDVYDSSIDDGSGDPVVTPAAPLPVTLLTSATIGPQGGAIQSDDGRMTLKIPAGALSSPIPVAITTLPPDSSLPNALGPAYQISPATLALAKPGLLTLRLQPLELQSGDPHWFGLAFQSGSSWFVPAAAFLDPSQGTLTTALSSVSPAASRTTSGRMPMAGGGTGKWSGWVEAEILPSPATVDPAGQSALKVYFYLWNSPSPDGQSVQVPPNFWPLNITGWSVNGVPGGDDANGRAASVVTPPDGVPQGLYSAPLCFPSGGNPVQIGLTYTGLPPQFAKLPVRGYVQVLPKDYSIEIEMVETETSLTACVTYDVTQLLKGTFQLDQNGNVTNVRFGQAEITSETKHDCAEPLCTVMKTSDSLITAAINSGRFDSGNIVLDLTVAFQGTLGLTLNCVTPLGPQPPVPVGTVPGPTLAQTFTFVIDVGLDEYADKKFSSSGVNIDYFYTISVTPTCSK
jgi:hypothetical protein